MWIQIILSLICHPPWIGFAPITIPLDEWANRLLVLGEVIMFSGCDMNQISSSLIYYALKPSLLKLSSFPHLWISQLHHSTTITCDVDAPKKILSYFHSILGYNMWL